MAHCISFSVSFIVLLLIIASSKADSIHDHSPVVAQDDSIEKHDGNLIEDSPGEESFSSSVENLLEETFDRLVSGEKLSEEQVNEPNPQQDAQNITSSNNDTSPNVPSHRWPCKSFNITANASTVILNNETEYTSIFARMNSTHGCGLLLFYSPHCEFCTKLAPLYNALGRAYPDLAVMAVNVEQAMRMAAGYGVVGIPTVFFFYSGRPVSKFNQSRDLASFQKFIQDLTGYLPSGGAELNITEADMDGPITTQVIESPDYYLIFSVVFLVTYIVLRFFGSKLLSVFANLVHICFNIQSQLVGFLSRGVYTRTRNGIVVEEKDKVD